MICLKLFVTVTKKALAVMLAAAIAALVLISRVSSLNGNVKDGSTNAKRVQFIEDLGYSVNETPCVKETVIPESFTNVYEKYNALQKQAGFDLTCFKGKRAEVYGYTVLNGEKTVTLIVVNGEIAGGDIASAALNGEMLPLIHIE